MGRSALREAQLINVHSGQKTPDYFGEILQVKVRLGKYLKEK